MACSKGCTNYARSLVLLFDASILPAHYTVVGLLLRGASTVVLQPPLLYYSTTVIIMLQVDSSASQL